MAKAIKLSESETDLLSKASARRDGSVVPLSEDADSATTAKTTKRIGRLLAAGLIEERPTKSATSAWRSDDSGQRYALRITAAGRVALEAPSPTPESSDIPLEQSEMVRAAPLEPRGKLGAVLSAVRDADGAALSELVGLTGWQPHTVRASLTRLRQGGFSIHMATTATGRRYVIQGAAGGDSQ